TGTAGGTALQLDPFAGAGRGEIPMAVTHAVWNQIQLNDFRLMRRVHRWPAPRWFRILMVTSTRLGDGWIWYALAVMLLLFGGPQRFLAVASATSAGVAGIFVFRALKSLSRRRSPCEFEPHCWASILPPDKYSFPSGHTIS